ncbi:MAG: hypothetical protein IPG96_19480 [Proteobacteria bacterium]|nr:hypothetical protein [Pseudomonadota bacterium]
MLVACIAAVSIAELAASWSIVFDDAFISYRYAHNLARGHGLVWNLADGPTEGYTNLLWVLMLAPAAALGLDLLLVSRLVSVLAVLATSWLLGRASVVFLQASRSVALLVGAAYLCLNRPWFIAAHGMETTLFAALLLGALLAAVSFLDDESLSSLLRFAVLGSLALLMRPEASLLLGAFGLMLVIRRKTLRRGFGRAMLSLGISTVLPWVLIAAWRWWYFGSLLPNPFFIKGAQPALVRPMGLRSVMDYLQHVDGLLALAVVSALWPNRRLRPHYCDARILALLVATAFAGFFLRIDTLQDAGQRFMYPVTPLLLLVALPVLVPLLYHLLTWPVGLGRRLAVGIGIFATLIHGSPELAAREFWQVASGTAVGGGQVHPGVAATEALVARKLARFPHIAETSLAFGDAGTLADFTDSTFIDLVGLNARFIATQRDIGRLLAYLFDKRPTIIIVPTRRDLSLITFRHGPLGDWSTWTKHASCRWHEYGYVGTTFTLGAYDLSILVRRDDRHAAELAAFLRRHVISGRARAFPLPVGELGE